MVPPTPAPAPTSADARACRAAPLPASERRACVIAATLPLLHQHGSAVTSKQIAAAAGVSEGTIFKVFADKDELIRAAFDAAIDPAPFEAAVGAVDASLSFEQQLVAATELIQRRIVDVWRLVTALGPQHHPARRPVADSPALVALCERWSPRLRIEPVEAARLLHALTLSLTHPMMIDRPRSPDDVVEMFLHGVAARKRGSR